MSEGNSSSGGFGILSVVGIVFVTLKLTETIDWSWWWVTAPFWVPVVLTIVILALVFVFVAVASFFD